MKQRKRRFPLREQVARRRRDPTCLLEPHEKVWLEAIFRRLDELIYGELPIYIGDRDFEGLGTSPDGWNYNITPVMMECMRKYIQEDEKDEDEHDEQAVFVAEARALTGRWQVVIHPKRDLHVNGVRMDCFMEIR